jgi:OHCU decarboxylase
MSINDLPRQAFVELFGGLYEHSAWIVDRAYTAGLTSAHDDPELLSTAFRVALEDATRDEKLGLIRAHPDLVGKAAIAGELTDESTVEQSSAGLHRCSEEEFKRFTHLNSAYKEKFKFPFILAVRERQKEEILVAFEDRLQNEVEVEFDQALSEINQIARLRLDALLQTDALDQLLNQLN